MLVKQLSIEQKDQFFQAGNEQIDQGKGVVQDCQPIQACGGTRREVGKAEIKRSGQPGAAGVPKLSPTQPLRPGKLSASAAGIKMEQVDAFQDFAGQIGGIKGIVDARVLEERSVDPGWVDDNRHAGGLTRVNHQVGSQVR